MFGSIACKGSFRLTLVLKLFGFHSGRSKLVVLPGLDVSNAREDVAVKSLIDG